MDNNDSNIKPQQTGGLKLMTVFVVVLALHVLVIGGFATYYLLKGGSADDALTDKDSKNEKVASDNALPGETQTTDSSDKSGSPTTTDANGGTTTPSLTPPADQTQTTAPETSTASTVPASQPPASTPAPATDATSTPETAPAPSAPATTTASSPPPTIAFHLGQTGPVINPPSELAPAAPAPVTTPTPAADAAETAQPETTLAPTPDVNLYVVKAHDSLAKIAHFNHISVAKLKEANSLNSNVLQIGQKLTIPGKTDGSATTVATSITPLAPAPITPATTDTATNKAAATTLSTAPAQVASMVAQTTPKPVKAVKTVKTTTSTSTELTASTTAPLQHHIYTVIKGDTLTKIAHKFKTTPNAIMTANNITDPTKLSIGKKLRIPSRESRSASNNVPAPSVTHAVAPPVAPQPAQVETQPVAPTGQLANFLQ